MITGFQATLEVNDGASSASVKFAGNVTFNLPALEATKFNATELDQQASSVADPYERELPTGLITIGATKGEIKYLKSNYTRLQALLGVRGKTFIITTPDDQTTPGTPVKMTCTFTGFVSKLDDVKFEKNNPVMIPFEITVPSKPTYA